MLQPQDLALTMFGSYLRTEGQLAWSGGMVQLLGEFGFSVEASRAALNRLAIRELIVRTKRGRQVFYGLAPHTQRLLAEGDRRIYGFGQEVEDVTTWTVLWHSLPDELRAERARMSRRLRFLGFGSVQDATWVAPHDREDVVVDLLTDLGVAHHACVIVGRPAAALDVGAVLREAWDLDDVNRQYVAFLDEFAAYASADAQRALDDREAFAICTRATHVFRQFPFLDPELPDRLMPDPTARTRAVATFHAITDGLRPAAARHFDAVAGADRERAAV